MSTQLCLFSQRWRDRPEIYRPVGEPINPRLYELGRFVLLDSVPANGESWFLARTFESLRHKGLSGVVSFSDPVLRTKANGTLVHRGHIGICYQATSATFLGRTEPRTIRLLPDGTLLSDRTIQGSIAA